MTTRHHMVGRMFLHLKKVSFRQMKWNGGPLKCSRSREHAGSRLTWLLKLGSPCVGYSTVRAASPSSVECSYLISLQWPSRSWHINVTTAIRITTCSTVCTSFKNYRWHKLEQPRLSNIQNFATISLLLSVDHHFETSHRPLLNSSIIPARRTRKIIETIKWRRKRTFGLSGAEYELNKIQVTDDH